MPMLTDKVAVITGASGVIGRETIDVFKREGARVAAIDLKGEPGQSDDFRTADLTDEAQVRDAYRDIHERFGRIDVLFNNAGIAEAGDASVLETEVDVWDRVLDANLKSVFLCCKHGIPWLLDGGGGSVINTASLVASMGSATSQVAYTASKGGVLSMSRELGVEFAKRGVRVNAISPGPVDTPLLRSMFSPDESARRLVHVPTGRFADPREIAEVVAFLASDRASYLNAGEFRIDGGITSAYVTATDPSQVPGGSS